MYRAYGPDTSSDRGSWEVWIPDHLCDDITDAKDIVTTHLIKRKRKDLLEDMKIERIIIIRSNVEMRP